MIHQKLNVTLLYDKKVTIDSKLRKRASTLLKKKINKQIIKKKKQFQ
jgi:hypothetical protein